MGEGNDDLDALFGALDGDASEAVKDDSVEGDQPLTKKARIEPLTREVEQSDDLGTNGTVDVDRGDTDSPPARTDNEPTASNVKQKSAYASVMSKPTTSELIESSSGRVNADETKKVPDPTSAAEEDKEREIATGTSHDKSVRSYSAYPKNLPSGHQPTPVKPGSKPAKTYAFQLDPFQTQAIKFIEQDESVLVAAHTSAGKTAVAEYAIAKSLQQGQRVVYTSPIKALSNQKFRDLQEEFKDVGLMTGDITINPQATVLVMTTEILRSMLYRGSEIMREVAWCIYDEVHYMRDSERGVVWEESIILLPHRVRFVFLSATIPNAAQFADWICEIHHQPCHVVYTNYRPVPLQHYIFPQGGDGLHLVVDERGHFREANFQRAMATLQSGTADVAAAEAMLSSGEGSKKSKVKNKTKKGGPNTDLKRIVGLIMDRNLSPVIVFSFSKRDCERYALALIQEDYTDDVEKDLISQVYHNAIESLGEDDRKLPQVEALLPLLKRGIGIHHGGLLPILKEIVEILFAEGLIKTLFATETFSIGINMPAKTVVFTNTRKWDGKDFRWVTSGEYIQMSGRAGRRGKDDRGIVIQMLDQRMEPAVCKSILYGSPDPLNSSYRISYNMLLNLMRVEDVDPEYLLRASFHQFQREKDAPAVIAQAESFQEEAEGISIGSSAEEAELASQYYQMDQQLLLTRRKIAKIVRQPQYVLKFLSPGRLLDISIDGAAFGWGVLVSCKKRTGTGSGGEAGQLASLVGGPEYILDVLLSCVDRHFDSDDKKGRDEDAENLERIWRGSGSSCRPVRAGDEKRFISMRLFTLGLEGIERLSAVKLFVPQDITIPEGRRKVSMSLAEVQRRLAGTLPLLDPVEDLGIKTEEFLTLLKRAEALTERISAHKLSTNYGEKERLMLVEAYEKKAELLEKAKALREEARGLQTLSMKDTMQKMKRVLKKLGHVDANGVIQTKGPTACEINTANELVVVELMFTGVFNDLTVEQCCALLSCMTFDEPKKSEEDSLQGLKSYLTKPFFKLKEVARTVARVEISCGIELNEEEFVDHFNPGMMEAVFAWCKGAKFVEVQKLTGSFEGTTIRTLRRLEELVRQITVAAKAIGNQELEAKFAKGDELLKRDIVFCSSLYL